MTSKTRGNISLENAVNEEWVKVPKVVWDTTTKQLNCLMEEIQALRKTTGEV